MWREFCDTRSFPGTARFLSSWFTARKPLHGQLGSFPMSSAPWATWCRRQAGLVLEPDQQVRTLAQLSLFPLMRHSETAPKRFCAEWARESICTVPGGFSSLLLLPPEQGAKQEGAGGWLHPQCSINTVRNQTKSSELQGCLKAYLTAPFFLEHLNSHNSRPSILPKAK